MSIHLRSQYFSFIKLMSLRNAVLKYRFAIFTITSTQGIVDIMTSLTTCLIRSHSEWLLWHVYMHETIIAFLAYTYYNRCTILYINSCNTSLATLYICVYIYTNIWWRHQMKTFFALLAQWRGIHRSPVNSPHKDQWRGALMFPLICAWISVWANNREAGDLRRHLAYHDVIAMLYSSHLFRWPVEIDGCAHWQHFWCWNRYIPGKLGEYYGRGCPNSLRTPRFYVKCHGFA